MQTTFPSSLILPNDNTSGFVTGMAIANLSMRGTIQFENMSGGGLAGIGLRFSPFGTFTSVPILLLP